MRPELEEILDLSDDAFREAVLRNAAAIAYEVKTLDDEQQRRIAEIVVAVWPKDGMAANIEREERQVRFLDLGAHAWFTLGPALDLVPTPEQWASLATSGTVLTDTSQWLHSH